VRCAKERRDQGGRAMKGDCRRCRSRTQQGTGDERGRVLGRVGGWGSPSCGLDGRRGYEGRCHGCRWLVGYWVLRPA
jgi:hypothetical protein